MQADAPTCDNTRPPPAQAEVATKDDTYRHVSKCTAAKRGPYVFRVRVPNNGRVLAAAISHQVVNVALPGHV